MVEVHRPKSQCCHAETKVNAVLLRDTVNYREDVHQSTDCITSMRCSEIVGELRRAATVIIIAQHHGPLGQEWHWSSTQRQGQVGAPISKTQLLTSNTKLVTLFK